MNRETWKFINTFAPWLSAIGTIAAVIVSLYLASARSKIKLRITAGHRVLAGLGNGTFPDYLFIGVTNIGFRPARIPADWLNQFSNNFIGRPVRLRLCTLRLQVSTSVGKTFERPIENNLRKKIIEAALMKIPNE